MAPFELVASKLAALKPRFGSNGGGVKTGSGGKNDGGRPVSAAGRGGGGGRGSGTLRCSQFLDFMIEKFIQLRDRASCRNQIKRNKIQHTYEDNCLKCTEGRKYHIFLRIK